MGTASLDDLLSPGEPEEVVLPSGKGAVWVKHLSRRQVFDYRNITFETEGNSEAYLISASMAEPEMTLDQAQRWREVARDDDVRAVMEKIMFISGFSKDAAKETYKSPGTD